MFWPWLLYHCAMPSDFEIAVGQRVRQTRVLANLSQDDLAAKVGLSQWQISATENGARPTPIGELKIIADVLNTTVVRFVADEPSPPSGVRSLRSPNRDLPPEAYEEIANFIRWVESKYSK